MKNYLTKSLDLLFPTKNVDKNKINQLLNNRNFLDRKNDFFSILPYRNKTVREGIKNLKFKNNKKNGYIFGEILFENISEYLIDLEIQENFYNPIIITVPLSFFRQLKRGYNQNDLIIESFMKNGGENFVKWEKNILIKKHRKPQSRTRTKKERIQNQKNAYKLRYPNKIKDKNIILFDDIYTTGATINEIKKVLKKAGVKNVKVIVLAH